MVKIMLTCPCYSPLDNPSDSLKDSPMETIALTYRELADKMGVKLDSARKTVLRKKWQRVTGNDGTVRIYVPVDALPSHSDSQPDSPGDGLTVRELQAKVEALGELLNSERRRADAAELDRDRWHAEAIKPWWRKLAG